MHFKRSERLAATGIAGLAALTAAQWLRDTVTDPGPITAFTLGVMPNLTAAFVWHGELTTRRPRTAHAEETALPRAPQSAHSFFIQESKLSVSPSNYYLKNSCLTEIYRVYRP